MNKLLKLAVVVMFGVSLAGCACGQKQVVEEAPPPPAVVKPAPMPAPPPPAPAPKKDRN